MTTAVDSWIGIEGESQYGDNDSREGVHSGQRKDGVLEEWLVDEVCLDGDNGQRLFLSSDTYPMRAP